MDIEAGLVVPRSVRYCSWNKYFASITLPDLLDTVTLIYKHLKSVTFEQQTALNWREFAKRVLVENSIAYELDEECGVHPLVDHEFSHNKSSTLICLGVCRT